MEEKCNFLSGPHEIEGLIDIAGTEKGMIITHPHPLYGGNMHNHIVDLICRVFNQKGYTTLRFNFRGVGKSQGRFDQGVGEQQDLNGAIAYMNQLGIKKIFLAGYSFGAWVNALGVQGKTDSEGMIMISPPVAFMGFNKVSNIQNLELVITGGKDEIAPAGMIEAMLPDWNKNTRFEIIKQADHFYTGCLDKLESVLTAKD